MPDSNVTLAKAVGSLEAQVRELIHDNNNRGQRDEAVARSLGKLEHLPGTLDKVADAVTKMDEAIDARLKVLETEHIRREQTASIGVLILRSPLIGWVLGVVTAAGAIIFGRHAL